MYGWGVQGQPECGGCLRTTGGRGGCGAAELSGVVRAKGFPSEPEAQPSSVLLDKGQGVC